MNKFIKSFAVDKALLNAYDHYIYENILVNIGDTLDVNFLIEFNNIEDIEYFEIKGPNKFYYKSTDLTAKSYAETIYTAGDFTLSVQGKGTTPVPPPETKILSIYKLRLIFNSKPNWVGFLVAKAQQDYNYAARLGENRWSTDMLYEGKLELNLDVTGYLNNQKEFFYDWSLNINPTLIKGIRTRKFWKDSDIYWDVNYEKKAVIKNGFFKTIEQLEQNKVRWGISEKGDDNYFLTGVMYISPAKHGMFLVLEPTTDQSSTPTIDLPKIHLNSKDESIIHPSFSTSIPYKLDMPWKILFTGYDL